MVSDLVVAIGRVGQASERFFFQFSNLKCEKFSNLKWETSQTRPTDSTKECARCIIASKNLSFLSCFFSTRYVTRDELVAAMERVSQGLREEIRFSFVQSWESNFQFFLLFKSDRQIVILTQWARMDPLYGGVQAR